jgi:predicted secreted Zn-dependent protease
MSLGFFTTIESGVFPMSINMRLAGSIFAFISMAIVSQAHGKPTTNYTHYLIAGESAEGLYRSMLRKGPHVGGGKAYASTKMVPEVSARTVQTGKGCRIENFHVNMTFTIRLPQLKKSSNLDPSLRKSFTRFYEFAKKHEETHRSIWLKCAAEAKAQVNKVKAKSCSDAEARGLAIVEEVAKRCDARHVAFDVAEQRRLVDHPFIKQVIARHKKRTVTAHAGAAKRKKTANN